MENAAIRGVAGNVSFSTVWDRMLGVIHRDDDSGDNAFRGP
jgi:hypothetical protein